MKSFDYECTFVSQSFPVISFGWVQQQTHQKVMTGNGQLTKVHSQLNDFIRNLYFSKRVGKTKSTANLTVQNRTKTLIPRLSKNFSSEFNLSGEYLAVSPFWYHLKARQLYE